MGGSSSDGEFDLIDRINGRLAAVKADGVVVGIGDDGAVLHPPPGSDLVVVVDTLVEGRHFLPGTDAAAIAHKALAVNISDLTAMAASARWATLALTLPTADAMWRDRFMDGWVQLASSHSIALVGGDTTAGPMTISVQLMGVVAAGTHVSRGGAKVGDDIWVTGNLGDAALALNLRLAGQSEPKSLAQALDYPAPPTRITHKLAEFARAAIDLSDGLVADLGHICQLSGVGAQISLSRLPLSPDFTGLRPASWQHLPLAGGDDYQLCFTAEPSDRAAVVAAGLDSGTKVTLIGAVVEGAGVQVFAENGSEFVIGRSGFDHFKMET